MNTRILFFDGHCNLCNAFVDFLIRKDRKARLAFASLQGQTAQEILPEKYRLSGNVDPDSVIYWRDGSTLLRSEAALLAISDLGGFWKALQVFRIIPAFLRDWVYRCVAKNRFRLFGRRSSCRMPEPHERGRLLS